MPNQYLTRLGEIAEELGTLHRELATLLSAEAESKVLAWATSQETSIQGRDRQATANAVPLTQDIFRIKADIAALQEERDHLRLLVYVAMEMRKDHHDSIGPSAPNDQRLLTGHPSPTDATGRVGVTL